MREMKRLPILIALIVGLLIGGSIQLILSRYQGHTAIEWANRYNEAQKDETRWNTIAHACAEDPSSKDCYANTSYAKEYGFTLDPYTGSCSKEIISSADIVWHYKNCPTTTSTLQSSNSSDKNSTIKTETYLQCSGSVGDNGQYNSQCYPQTYTEPQYTNVIKSVNNKPVTIYNGQ